MSYNALCTSTELFFKDRIIQSFNKLDIVLKSDPEFNLVRLDIVLKSDTEFNLVARLLTKMLIDSIFYGAHSQMFAAHHGPGGWSDPDQLVIGNDGLTVKQSKTQMAFWCLRSAPLLMSNDLRHIKSEFKAILQNKHLIALNQDPLGIMGHRVSSEHHYEVWVKKLCPESAGAANPYAVLYFNYNDIGVPHIMSHKLSEIIPELNQTLKYKVHDLYADGTIIDTLTAHDQLTLRVPISGAVRLVKLVPESESNPFAV